jgi:hypothetical protein
VEKIQPAADSRRKSVKMAAAHKLTLCRVLVVQSMRDAITLRAGGGRKECRCPLLPSGGPPPAGGGENKADFVCKNKC